MEHKFEGKPQGQTPLFSIFCFSQLLNVWRFCHTGGKENPMSTIVFDSYTFVKRLKATGFTEEQAEVIVDASRDALGSLVTKDDLKVVEVALRNDMQAMELRLTIKLGAFMAVVGGVIIAVLRMHN